MFEKFMHFLDSLLNKLKDAVNDYCRKIEEQTKSSLSSIEPDLIYLLDVDQFKKYVLEKASNRY